MPNLDTSETLISPATETGSQSHLTGDDALSQAMLRVLEKVIGPHSESGGSGLVTELLWSNGVELFRGVTGVALTMSEYWLKAIKRIMNDIDCTPEQKLKGAVSLLCDEAYQWWLSVEEDTQPDHLNWDYFKISFQRKYMGVSYVDTSRREFMNLTLRDSLRVLITPQREREFVVLVDKAKIAEKVKRVEYQNRDRERGKNKRDSKSSSFVQRPKKWVRSDGPVRVKVLVTHTRIQACGGYGRCHPSECWRRLRVCLWCGYLEYWIRECPHRTDQM
ncbi:uncharacterized protein LOC105766899 [Gossypium raimondii]|uniref:uncharacterized protein LOC105766899 n=1 Tax=Gossypium raimondii TaxID=29730 RepID=UPI00063A9130|nr:uncharacterized protein LOC105766899 [Gossypium raimondii]